MTGGVVCIAMLFDALERMGYTGRPPGSIPLDNSSREGQDSASAEPLRLRALEHSTGS